MRCLEDENGFIILFVILAALLTYLIAKHNHFGVKDSVMAALGRKSFERTALINLTNVAALTIPLGWATWIVVTCGA